MEYFLGLIANEVGDMKKDLMTNGMVSHSFITISKFVYILTSISNQYLSDKCVIT